MVENEQQTDSTTLSKRKSKLHAVGRVLGVLFTSIFVLVFVQFVLIGYLSWFGIAAGVLFVGWMVTSCFLSLIGEKRFKQRLDRICNGACILIVIIVLAVTFLWPEGDDTWKPYRFEDELAEIEAERAVPDPENAAVRYESVLAAIDVNDRPDFLSGSDWMFTDHPWKGDDHPEASKWLNTYSEVINGLRSVTAIEKCRWPVKADLWDDYIVPYEKLRRLSWFLTAAGNRDIGEDRLDEAMAKYYLLLAIADHLRQQPDSVTLYSAFAYENMAMHMIRYVLVEQDLPDGHVEDIAGHLPSPADTWREDLRGLLDVEKLVFMNLLARVYEVNDKGDVRFAAAFAHLPEVAETHEPRSRKDRLWRIFHLMNMPLDPKALRRMADRHFAGIDRLFKSDRLPQTNEYQEPSFWSVSFLSKLACNPYRWAIEQIMFDAEHYIKLRQRHAIQVAERRGTWLVLGLRRHRNVHGRWPQKLDQISEYVPPEVFLDPTNGDKFLYTNNGDSFTLYSKGINCIDEGGRRGYVRDLDKSEDDIAIWPPREQETVKKKVKNEKTAPVKER